MRSSCRSSAAGRRFELIDTAGLRRRGKVFEAVEKFSVVKTLQAIADANVVLLLLDATQGVTDQDAHIAGYILESGRAVVDRGQQVGRGRRLPAARRCSARSSSASPFLQLRAGAAHLGDQAPGPRAGVEGDRRRPRLGDAQAADAGADAAAAGGGRAPGAEARRRVPAEAALRAPGRHEPADRSWSTATRSSTSPTPTSATSKGASAPTSSSSARRCASRCARRRTRSWTSDPERHGPYADRRGNPCVNVLRSLLYITEHIVSNKGQLLQDPFLNLLRKEHVPVSIYLVNGIKLQGHIESFDQYVVLLRNTVTQMVYKHAISTVVPGRAVNFQASEPSDSPEPPGPTGPLPADSLLERCPPPSRRRAGAARAILVGVDFGGACVISTRRSTSSRCSPNRPATSPVARVVARRKAPDAALLRRLRQGRRAEGAGRGAPGRSGAVRPGAVAGAAAQPRAPPRRRRSPTARC